MKKLSQIEESIWGDMRRRADTKSHRKEEEVGNLDQLQPVDMGGFVLWADKDLEIDGNKFFTFEEAIDFVEEHETEWRLPTDKDIAELVMLNDKQKFKTEKDRYILTSKYEGELNFNRDGFLSYKNKLRDEGAYYGWLSTIYQQGLVKVMKIDIANQVSYSVEKIECKLCIRLVKDKLRKRKFTFV